MHRYKALCLAAATAAGAVLSLSPIAAQAQAAGNWPDKPVRLVLPYPPGGNVDGAARIISDQLQAQFKQPFLVDNKPGAGGLIAGEFVAKAAPDGYTFFMTANGPLLFSPTIFKRDAYDWRRDFVPVSSVSFTPLVLQVNPSTPYKTIGELIEAGKKSGNKLTMASPGAGTQNHLVSEYLQRDSGAHWGTVHYKGNAPATTDLLGGQVDFNFDQISVAQPFIQQGRTRPLAVTSPQRLPQLPDVPTLQESGFKDFSTETFTGLMAPKGTPEAIVQRLSQALQKILADKAVQERFNVLGSQARAMTPAEFTQFLDKEDKRWIPIIKQANITAQ
ncbi:MAG: tripartite tricarboxylate transporter substrate binding protein [Pseudacidovorax sp.]|uniref:Bug family tripartite tricarboxylate transporter substrate binding protein n=1 Tax=Pseudacidovorax sp. TaxID=1934311 RepID=UPI001B55C289|nr:tripartite tricarboxylate transporter substrate binding protein [Pseudacidovorax sp.]MBP6896108.1 tripartite tricarboxylate transporter substrate binding protein [Pseudacidovorax sp.]